MQLLVTEEEAAGLRGRRLAVRAKSLGLTQVAISEALLIEQSQVSRVFSGKIRRSTPVFEKICKYVENAGSNPTPQDIAENHDLVQALREVWDGSSEHARALAAVIRSLGVLGERRR